MSSPWDQPPREFVVGRHEILRRLHKIIWHSKPAMSVVFQVVCRYGAVERDRETYTGFQAPEPVHMTWDTDRAANICSPAEYRSLESQKGSLAASRSAGGEIRTQRMDGKTPERILRFTPLQR